MAEAEAARPASHRPGRNRRFDQGRHGRGVLYPRWLWPAFATPGMLWLALFFLLPLYVVLSIAFGTVDPVFRSPIPVWNPLNWDPSQFQFIFGHLVGDAGFFGPPMLRTFLYVAAASIVALVVGYPVAYFVARFAGRRRVLFLVLLLAPFCVSYMMRMLAWVNLLEVDGLVNHTLGIFGVTPVAWLSGQPITVVLGLVYGYIPYMILPLYAGLDRIDNSLLEAARDLGAGRFSTFRRVTLPMSRPAILTGLLIVSLPMFGDYFTNDLLSGSPRTSMLGNLINTAVSTPGEAAEGAAFVLLLFALLIPPMVYYAMSTSRHSMAEA
ncbi:MAG: ABC transporter permease [Candidatus Dormibacteria bacterium]